MALRNLVRKWLPWHLVRKSAATYARDGLWTIHNADFMSDPAFRRAYSAGRATGSWGDADIEWRAHVALWAASQALHVQGDFIEFGVNRGGLSRAIVEYLDWSSHDRLFYLLDTFEGFDGDHPPSNSKEWFYTDTHEAVLQSFKAFSGIEIVKGSVPGTLSQVPAETIAYAHIDMNSVGPEEGALAWVWPRLSVGGIILLDDYGWRGHEPQKTMHDAFATARNHKVLTLPTGQGLLIRQA